MVKIFNCLGFFFSQYEDENSFSISMVKLYSWKISKDICFTSLTYSTLTLILKGWKNLF